MSDATERLRSLLDERGVEWEECRVPTLRSELAATFWYDRDGNPCSAVEGADDVPDGMLSVQANLTPEQAIEATLGRGECRDIEDSGTDFCCSACGARLYIDTGDTYTMIAADEHTIIKRPNFCPNCGRAVRA